MSRKTRYAHILTIIALIAMVLGAIHPAMPASAVASQTIATGLWAIQAGEHSLTGQAAGVPVSFQPGQVILGGQAGLSIEFESQAAPTGANAGRGRATRYTGSDPQSWQTSLPIYRQIHYPDVFPGIDLAWHAAPEGIESVYTVAPYADPGQIRWSYSGAQAALDATGGQIYLATSQGSATEQPPIAWQTIGGLRIPVSAAFIQHDDLSFGFKLGAYIPALPLIIDPTISFSLDLSSDYTSDGRDMLRMPSGDLLIGGSVQGSLPGFEDAAHSSGGVYALTDQGNLEQVAPDPVVGYVTAFAAGDGFLLLGTLDNGIFISQDDGQTWQADNQGLPTLPRDEESYRQVNILAVSPHQPQQALALVAQEGLYQRNTDGVWELLSDDTKLNSSTGIQFDALHPQVVIAYTSFQALRSIDGGVTWETFIQSRSVSCLTPTPSGGFFRCEYPDVFRVAASDGPADTLQTTEIYSRNDVYFNAIAVHEDEQKIAMLVSGFLGLTYLANTAVINSDDGGETWRLNAIFELRTPKIVDFRYHGDDLLYFSEYGLQISKDDGATWQNANQGISSQLLTAPVIDPGGRLLTFASPSLDTFVMTLSPGNEITSLTIFGGAGDDVLNKLALDPAGGYYLSGTTRSLDLPIPGGDADGAYADAMKYGQCAFVTRFDASGELLATRCYGTNQAGSASAKGLAIDSQGRVILSGVNGYADFDTTTKVFVVRYDQALASIDFERVFGGEENDRNLHTRPEGLLVDAQDNIFIFGSTSTTNFPLVNSLQPRVIESRGSSFWGHDAFLTHFNPNGEIVWSTLYGGDSDERFMTGVVTADDKLILAGYSSSGSLSDGSGGLIRPSGGIFALQQDGTWQPRNDGLARYLFGEQVLAVSADNPQWMATGVTGYGIYFTRDGGQTWSVSNLDIDAVTSMSVAGFGDWFLSSSYSGVYLSQDAGQTWQITPELPSSQGASHLALREGVSPDGPPVISIVYSLNNYKYSTDGGSVWQTPQYSPQAPTSIRKLIPSPTDPGLIFMITNDGLYRSEDSGQTWTQVVEANYPSFEIIFDPTDPALLTLHDNVYKDTLVSQDSGATWAEADPLDFPLFRKLLVDPTTPGELYLLAEHGLIHHSTDGGQTWSEFARLPGMNDFYLTAGADGTQIFGVVDQSDEILLAQFDPATKSLDWARLLGGPEHDSAASLLIAGDGSLYLGGETGGLFPGVSPVNPDPDATVSGLIAHLSPDGQDILQAFELPGTQSSGEVKGLVEADQGVYYTGSQWTRAALLLDISRSDQQGYAGILLDADPTPTPLPTSTPLPSPTPQPQPTSQPAGGDSTPAPEQAEGGQAQGGGLPCGSVGLALLAGLVWMGSRRRK